MISDYSYLRDIYPPVIPWISRTAFAISPKKANCITGRCTTPTCPRRCMAAATRSCTPWKRIFPAMSRRTYYTYREEALQTLSSVL